MADRFNDTSDYAIDGMDLNSLWRISCRINDGMKALTGDERRDMAQAMQAMLGGATKITPELCRDYLMHETNSDVEN